MSQAAKLKKTPAAGAAGDATHEVVRPIPGSPFAAGDRVDASGWRNREKLERARYIRPLANLESLLERTLTAEARVVELEAKVAELEAQLAATSKAAAGTRR